MGLAAVMGCKAAGATRIIGVDRKLEKFQIGKQHIMQGDFYREFLVNNYLNVNQCL